MGNCEDCQLKRPTFGLPAEGKVRWCFGCATAHTGAADVSSSSGTASNYRSDDAGWEGWLAKLRQYKEEHGDCNVPYSWAEDPGLGRWVAKQWHSKKTLDRGEPSEGMTAGRAAELTALGFAWGLALTPYADPAVQVAARSDDAASDAGWEVWLAKLRQYKVEHGDCASMMIWAEDPQLGRWLDAQRQLKKKVDCGELGFGWEVGQAFGYVGWEGWLAKLARHKAAHGDSNAPGRWAEDPGLGSWVSRQRQLKKKLDRCEPCRGMTAARAATLTALGFAWEVGASNGKRGGDDAGWCWLAKLDRYKAAHGDCGDREICGDRRLAAWVNKQRQFKKKLDRGEPCKGMTAGRAAKLTAPGFAWEAGASGGQKDDALWEVQLAKLAQYKALHGDCNVSYSWAEDPGLGRWVSSQRQLKKKLDRGKPCKGMTAGRAAKLTALGFSWEGGGTDDAGWLAKLARYQAAHGDCNVPFQWSQDPKFANWVGKQRKDKKGLDRG
jgi:hypothetical protein